MLTRIPFPTYSDVTLRGTSRARGWRDFLTTPAFALRMLTTLESPDAPSFVVNWNPLGEYAQSLDEKLDTAGGYTCAYKEADAVAQTFLLRLSCYVEALDLYAQDETGRRPVGYFTAARRILDRTHAELLSVAGADWTEEVPAESE